MRGVSGMDRKENGDTCLFYIGRRRTANAIPRADRGRQIKKTMTNVGLSHRGTRCVSLQVLRRDHSGIGSMLS